jgi:hypothetical protein
MQQTDCGLSSLVALSKPDCTVKTPAQTRRAVDNTDLCPWEQRA